MGSQGAGLYASAVGVIRVWASRILLVSVLSAQLLGCGLNLPTQVGAPAAAAPGAVKFKLAAPSDAAIVVQVKINGRGPYDFVLDTGATFTCVDNELAEQLKLPEWHGGLGTVVLTPVGGGMRLLKVETLEVGDAKASGLTVCALDLSRMQPPGFGVRGLVGLNFLKSYRMTIDFRQRVLRLDKP